MKRAAMPAAACLLAALLLVCPPAAAADPASPLSPDEALALFRTATGVRIELAAAEPEVIDPVAIRFDASGRMWVVEMRDYPHGPAAGEAPASCIKWLEDRDGDGRFETAHRFADQLLFVTGLQPWRGGVIVTMAGQIAYLKDTTGDGRADLRETWYRGFAEQNSQLRANHPHFALDHHVYVANGLRGGTVVDPRRDQPEPVSLSGKDFRFHPTTFAYEGLTGVSQFGLTFDDFGNRFVCSNRNPLIHIVLKDRYVSRNPSYAPPAAVHDVAAAGAASRIYPVSRAWTTSNLHAGQFTAACGVLLFRGNALSRRYYGNGFTCDPTGNLVHRELLEAVGATFRGRPARDGVEFLASPDEWFRPVNLAHGPDGALYVVDMYRAVIEHPQWVPEELKNRPDQMLGNDRGRIYRLTARAGRTPRVWPRLAELSSVQLAGLLEHPNAWQRETAARLLFERQDAGPAVTEKLAQLAVDGRHPAARVHALWALEGLGALDDPLLQLALRDAEPRVAEQAVVLAETRFADAPDLRTRVAALASSDDARLRFQVALTLAPIASDAETAALKSIAVAGAGDLWTRRAVAIAAGTRAADLLLAILDDPPWQARPVREADARLLGDLLPPAVTADPAVQTRLLTALATIGPDRDTARLQRTSLQALAQALARRGGNLQAALERLESKPAAALRQALADAARDAVDAGRDEDERCEAIDLLAYDDGARPALIELAHHEPAQRVRTRAIAALARSTDPALWEPLLAEFAHQSPPVRRAVVAAVLSRRDRAGLLLDAIAAGHVKPGELDRSETGRLLKHPDDAVRQRAAQLLAAAIPADRRQVLADYQVALRLEADAGRGRAVFQKNCATCHQIGDLGVNVAPDISDSRTRQPAQILTDVLQPNRAIDNNYVGYSVITTDGRQLTGIIAAETATSITLRQAEGKQTTLLRSEIDELRSSGVSLMPEGLEKNIPPQEMADLISFIKNWRYLDGRTPLGGE